VLIIGEREINFSSGRTEAFAKGETKKKFQHTSWSDMLSGPRASPFYKEGGQIHRSNLRQEIQRRLLNPRRRKFHSSVAKKPIE
jgi:hypothetical protein